LIVDNNSVIRRTIRRVISAFSDRIIECDDGAKTFSAYQTHSPDWVLMDVGMPEKDGLTATREICDAYPPAHVVIVTNYDNEGMREAAARAGACG
jgi:DNA-binding NarL/FixJ family response regulator